jgi:hypothetical protein
MLAALKVDSKSEFRHTRHEEYAEVFLSEIFGASQSSSDIDGKAHSVGQQQISHLSGRFGIGSLVACIRTVLRHHFSSTRRMVNLEQLLLLNYLRLAPCSEMSRPLMSLIRERLSSHE